MLIKIEFNDENKKDKEFLKKLLTLFSDNNEVEETIIKANDIEPMCTTTTVVENNIVSDTIPSTGVPVSSIPSQKAEINYTRNQLAEAMARAVNSKGAAAIKEILISFGYQTLVDVPEEKYNDLANVLISKGVEI